MRAAPKLAMHPLTAPSPLGGSPCAECTPLLQVLAALMESTVDAHDPNQRPTAELLLEAFTAAQESQLGSQASVQELCARASARNNAECGGEWVWGVLAAAVQHYCGEAAAPEVQGQEEQPRPEREEEEGQGQGQAAAPQEQGREGAPGPALGHWCSSARCSTSGRPASPVSCLGPLASHSTAPLSPSLSQGSDAGWDSDQASGSGPAGGPACTVRAPGDAVSRSAPSTRGAPSTNRPGTLPATPNASAWRVGVVAAVACPLLAAAAALALLLALACGCAATAAAGMALVALAPACGLALPAGALALAMRQRKAPSPGQRLLGMLATLGLCPLAACLCAMAAAFALGLATLALVLLGFCCGVLAPVSGMVAAWRACGHLRSCGPLLVSHAGATA